MSININTKNDQSPNFEALFELAFRPFFLSASLFSIVALLAWAAFWNGSAALNVYGGVMWWHIHEMLFGFAATIVVGFLLTAVQNWTGVRSINGRGLMLLFGVWLLARIAMFFPSSLAPWSIALLDMLFLPIAMGCLAHNIISAKLWRNAMFIVILFLMTLANAAMHYSVLFEQALLMSKAANGMVLLITLVMCIMGGRVFPMFTANGTSTPRTPALPWLEKLCIVSTVLAVILSFQFQSIPQHLVATVFIVSGFANGVRALRWKIWVALKTPLVWSLHLSYWAVAIGLVMYGVALVSGSVSQSQAVHMLTVGGMGAMILSMISRVSLGHTGRIIVVGKVMTTAFSLMLLALLVRVFGAHFPMNTIDIITLSSLLWVFAYSCFVALYTPILIRARVD
ncbi:NnrS family protein [Alginatibacterium sediminis]|uniref:NnrS family protein n=1 Tax=Alginatibacterium sediminis TaxID=2164068 RepID=A0A420EHG1_9ALTE|nr:NnrS family protein [Alginatibacterium sediminis]RKF20097.1 NnrS family protein [Alginatibacterium sediminis]